MAEFNRDDWLIQKEEIRAQAYEMLEDATKELSDPDIFKQYLDVQSRFDRYSVGNALLVAYQLPESTRLCDAKTWKEHGIYIQKGKKGILILEPGKEYKREDGSVGVSYNAKKVFDITQTDAPRQPSIEKHFDERLLAKALIKTSPVPIEISDLMPEEASAVYQPSIGKILIRQGMPGDEIFRSLSREIAFARLDKGDYSRDKFELAAYGISFMVCKRMGIEPYEIKSSKSLFKNTEPKGIRKQLSEMRTEANSITASMERTLSARNKDAR